MTNILLAGILILLAYVVALMEADRRQPPQSSNWHTAVFIIMVFVAVLFGALLIALIRKGAEFMTGS